MTSTMSPVEPLTAAGAPGRWLAMLSDAVTSAAAGRRARLRVGLSIGGLVGLRADRVVLAVDDVTFGGLDLASVRIRAEGARVVPGIPPHVRAGPVRVRVAVEQPALDRWLLAGALPVRITLRASGLRARAGVGGLRLAEAEAGIEIEEGRLVVTPQRARVLGVGVGAPLLRIPLPLPPLPRAARIERLTVTEGCATIDLRLPRIDEPLTPGQVTRLSSLLRAAPRPPVRRNA